MGTPASVHPAGDAGSFDVVSPSANCLVEALRAFSYELPTAIADLVDNSITAGAHKVWIDFHWSGADSVVAVTDDGSGMEEAVLVAAMRMGSKSPLAPRDPRDLGRFGLGLKTASFSQCRCVTVRTRTLGGGVATRRWDLDHVVRSNQWQLLHGARPSAERHLTRLGQLPAGTTVVWQDLDRLVAGQRTDSARAQDMFLDRASRVREYLSVVFHGLMRGAVAVRLFVNNLPLDSWDPFVQDDAATQILPATQLSIRESTVTVQPFVLPHHSKVSPSKFALVGGPRGWNAHQGFYVYRAGRLLVPGDWLGLFVKEEHYKLARIRIDIPNDVDHDWSIDVTKSRAVPPAELRDELRSIAERVRRIAKRVYTFRGALLTPKSDEDRVFLWEPVAKHGTVTYRLNRDHPLLKRALVGATPPSALSAALRLIEETVPAALITIQNTESPTSLRGPFEGVPEAQVREVMSQALRALTDSGHSHDEALDRLGALWPFELFPALIESLPRT
jgi:hypothetical protein